MFNGCTSLTTAPELPATELKEFHYQYMFSGCTSLSKVTCLAVNKAEGSTTNWLEGVAAEGVFVKDIQSTWEIGVNGIPEGWTVEELGTINAVTFTAEEAGSTIGLNYLSSYQALEYKTAYADWTSMSTSTNITLNNIGDKVYVRGVLSGNNTYSNYTQFKMTGKITASGNCNVLWNYNDLNAHLKEYCGQNMFSGCTSLIQAPELPATTLVNYCYGNMFSGCTSLTSAPELPASTLVDGCYSGMFTGCTSLTQAPELPATTLADFCYGYMFENCSRLTQAPELPATTLASNCYYSMFIRCSSLTQAPELPATTLAEHCYGSMFIRCSRLTQAPELPATTLANGCYSCMFDGCINLTTAPELPATTLEGYCYYSMFDGCINLTTAPELPASTLANNCYEYMFQNCSNLNYIKCLATNISATDCTNHWVSGVAPTGIFVKAVDASWSTGASGIPEGWTVIEE